MGKIFISCDEATAICDKNQYREASFMEKLRLNIHFIFCKYCRKYTKQNTLLSKIFGDYSKTQCGVHKLPEDEKKRLEEELKKKLK